MQVVFFCAGSSSSGMGHLLRCLALAQELQSRNHKVVFVLDPEASTLARTRSDWIGRVIEVKSNFEASTWHELKDLNLGTIQWTIIDAYNVHHNFFSLSKNESTSLALFDDLTYSNFKHVDLVINSAIELDDVETYYPCPNKVHFALGHHYQLLRQEFISIQPKSLYQREFITLCFGGADPDNLTNAILEVLSSITIERELMVITGPAYRHVGSLSKTLLKLNARTSFTIIHQHNVQNMAEIWNNSVLVISAGGSAQFELKACCTPSILIVVAENQRIASLESQRKGWCKTLVYNNDIDTLLAELTAVYTNLISDEETLLAMHKQANNVSSSHGGEHLSQLLESELIE